MLSLLFSLSFFFFWLCAREYLKCEQRTESSRGEETAASRWFLVSPEQRRNSRREVFLSTVMKDQNRGGAGVCVCVCVWFTGNYLLLRWTRTGNTSIHIYVHTCIYIYVCIRLTVPEMPPSAAVLRKGKREKTIGDFFFFFPRACLLFIALSLFVFLSCVSLFFLLSSSLLFSTYFHMTCYYFVFFFSSWALSE